MYISQNSLLSDIQIHLHIHICIAGNLYCQFISAEKAAYGSKNPIYAVKQHAQSAMRAAIGMYICMYTHVFIQLCIYLCIYPFVR